MRYKEARELLRVGTAVARPPDPKILGVAVADVCLDLVRVEDENGYWTFGYEQFVNLLARGTYVSMEQDYL